jgi:hypothetical protein
VAASIALVVAASGCAPPVGAPSVPVVTRWVIPAGQHDAVGTAVVLTAEDSIRFSVRFDPTAVYSSADPANQFDINKLRGRSDCSTHHHENSARVGWRWTGNAVELSAYVYVAGTRRSAVLGEVGIGAWHDLALDFTPTGYRFELDGRELTMPRGCSASGLLKYELWPYFGGDEVAPHDITIEVR